MNIDYFSDPVGFQTVAYTAVASLAVLLFDFIVTFDSEVHWTWGRGWGIIRIIFILSRYVPFVGLAMTVYGVRWLGITASEVLLVVRTYAILECNKRFLTLALVITKVISIAVLVMSDIGAIEFGDSTGVLEEAHFTSITYGLLMLVELVLMTLTLYKRFKFKRLGDSPLWSRWQTASPSPYYP
ncbi:hypothetical protein EDD22DRAFT_846634 [Suillus occidentalis]|nr:hypothetical protein EDD22DRAFT_846634 [Suillus occidentalis]